MVGGPMPELAGRATKLWSRLEDGRVRCDVCPRACALHEGQRGFCFVRARQDDQIVLTTWGRSSGFCVDPIEKKPLNQFYPGSSVLSFGTAGCNLGCKFCQNWDISKSREIDTLADRLNKAPAGMSKRYVGCVDATLMKTNSLFAVFAAGTVSLMTGCAQAPVAQAPDSPGKKLFN